MTEMKNLWHEVFVFGNTTVAAIEDVDEIFLAQAFYGFQHCRFVKRGYRVAIVFLVTGERQRVQSQGIILRRRYLFLDQTPEHSDFRVSKYCRHIELFSP